MIFASSILGFCSMNDSADSELEVASMKCRTAMIQASQSNQKYFQWGLEASWTAYQP